MDPKQIISNLPKSPGVYQFYDKAGKLLYIGKAKNLKSRVSSYFTAKKYESFKTKKLAKQVCDIKHIVVETESDALFLENNLIKQHQPKYNILLKDDKTFPWICIKNEPFPRVFSTRNRIMDGSEYFGPYTSAYMVKTLINLVRKLYQIRTCSFSLTKENISNNKFKVCLEHHIGNCKAPCIRLQDELDYQESIEHIRKILKGNLQDVLDYLYKHMLDLASKQKFEEANKIKEKFELLKRYQSKSNIVNPKINDLDVFSFIEEDDLAFINFIKINNGAIVQSHTVELVRKLDETKEEMLAFAIYDIRQKVFSKAKEAIVPFKIDSLVDINFTVPRIGDKKKILELSERNARQYAHQRNIQKSEIATKYNKSSLLDVVKTDLRLKETPVHIECFDNSNIQGSSPVAACVVFINGKPAAKEYRHFHIKSVVGANDFASMEEIIFRRYNRLMQEEKSLPQLIIIDGGKGQLGAAVNSLKKLNLYGKIAVLGIAKRLEEIYFPGDSVPLYLDKNSKTLRLIQHLRNEAHRFGITFHRKIRSKKMLQNDLLKIEGVGEKTFEKLVKTFGSIEDLKVKTLDEIAEIVPKSTAQKIIDFFKKEV
ncbi:MAG: excinuclease ABC subunit C [Bacteroidales bacterium]|nr:excinuclease ABC subunit C [Bacteroidales bacterium]MBN2821555.1 excinuclease ABC subunit C [Bacteroidales bacterium]